MNFRTSYTIIKLIIVISLFCMLFACKKISHQASESPVTSSYSSDFLYKWIDLHLEMIKFTEGYTPPVASRTIGYTYATLYESVVSGIPERRALKSVFNITALDSIPLNLNNHWPSTASAALAEALKLYFPLASSSFFEQIDSFSRQDSLVFLQDHDVTLIKSSMEYGRAIANAIYEWSKSDGGYLGFTRNYPSDYTAPVGPGYWVPTPTPTQPSLSFKPAMQPYWGNNRPFDYQNVGGQSILDVPPDFSIDTNSVFYQANQAVYQQSQNNDSLSTVIATFWADDLGTYSPPGHSLAITKIILEENGADLAKSAEVLLRVGMAVQDAFINCFKNKYIYNLIRPVSYIQLYINPNWNSTIASPPFPEYASCHSTQSAACAHILTHYFGTSYSFLDDSKSDLGYTARIFDDFYAFAQEAAISRYYGGVHYLFSCERGFDNGLVIGAHILNIDLNI